MESIDKRILKIPTDRLNITKSGRLEFPEILVECDGYRRTPACFRCLLGLSTRIFEVKKYDRKRGEIVPSIKHKDCHKANPPYRLPKGVVLSIGEEDIYNSVLFMGKELYEEFLPFILDLYVWRQEDTKDTGR